MGPDSNKIDAVYCTDLYKEQIEAEKDLDDNTDYFTQMFQDEVSTTDAIFWQWICPSTSSIDIDSNFGIQAIAVPCSVEPDAVYAKSKACSDEAVGDIHVASRVVSSNFDEYTYRKDNKNLQLYKDDQKVYLESGNKVSMKAFASDKFINLLHDNFMWSAQESVVNTTKLYQDES